MKLRAINEQIIACEACPRLRKHCLHMAEVKRRAYSQDDYWGKPITGFGDPKARILIVGLAPAAHGANRTGRIFTGDRSGEWLYRALHRAGFANQPESNHRDDGLKLNDVYVSCVVKCAPPDNKPDPRELTRCTSYLAQEIAALSKVQVYIALGGIALQGLWPLIGKGTPRPKFGHDQSVLLDGGKSLILSYHPSQQNTFTGRLTQPMFDQIFSRARSLLR